MDTSPRIFASVNPPGNVVPTGKGIYSAPPHSTHRSDAHGLGSAILDLFNYNFRVRVSGYLRDNSGDNACKARAEGSSPRPLALQGLDDKASSESHDETLQPTAGTFIVTLRDLFHTANWPVTSSGNPPTKKPPCKQDSFLMILFLPIGVKFPTREILRNGTSSARGTVEVSG